MLLKFLKSFLKWLYHLSKLRNLLHILNTFLAGLSVLNGTVVTTLTSIFRTQPPTIILPRGTPTVFSIKIIHFIFF